MRWNCPHCEEVVAASVDFESTENAYVRCAKCDGLALLHRSAALVREAKIRRAAQEARLNAGRFAIEGAAPRMEMRAPPPPSEAMMMAHATYSTEAPCPPAFITVVPPAPGLDLDLSLAASSSTPPNYAKPPAFLLRSLTDPVDSTDRSFALDDEPGTIEITLPASAPRASRIALWIAASLAIASGAYLYFEGRKALAPIEAPNQADEIRSKANSAVRIETPSLIIVRVSRATLRRGPAVEAEALQTLERAAVARMLESKDGWMKIESPRISTPDRTAWVRADLVARLPQ